MKGKKKITKSCARTRKVMLKYNKRLIMLLAMLANEKVMHMSKAAKLYNGSTVLTLEAVRKLRLIYKVNIEIYTRKHHGMMRFLILR